MGTSVDAGSVISLELPCPCCVCPLTHGSCAEAKALSSMKAIPWKAVQLLCFNSWLGLRECSDCVGVKALRFTIMSMCIYIYV